MLRYLLLAAALLSAGCSSAAAPAVPHSALRVIRAGGSASQYITNVVVIVQENRSFENFFAGFPGANAPMYGCAAPKKGDVRQVLASQSATRQTSGSGCQYGDTQVPLKKITFQGPDLGHNWASSMLEYNKGRMDGFSRIKSKITNAAYSYVNPSLTTPYWTMAQTYVLADEMFPTEWGGSFTAHLTLVAGNDAISQSPPNGESEVDFPNGQYDDCDSPPNTVSSYLTPNDKEHLYKGPFPCFTQFNTMAEVLDNAGVSWKYYATKVLDGGLWEPFEAMSYVRYGPDWNTDIVAPQTKILTDPGKGNLASVTWVSPSKKDSDHPAYGSDEGPSWVASVVNAIGESSYWNSSAIIIVWDDWGGWYDNASPPQLDYRGLGFRVPCLIISPYARETSASQPGYVTHTQYEYGSILKFIEEVYGLGTIGSGSEGYTDGRANSMDDAFDFTQQPRPFTAIPTKYPASHFIHEPPSNEPVDTQ
jgi:phospholipase C